MTKSTLSYLFRPHSTSLLFILLVLNMPFWLAIRDQEATWLNIPAAPGENMIKVVAMGDIQPAYRMIGIFLQNAGEFGGKGRSLKEYSYENLEEWFFLADKLDKRSHYVPFLAAYNFGATRQSEDLDHITDYLIQVGRREGEQRWRWLVRAFYIALYRQEKPEKALEIAKMLEDHPDPSRPEWSYRLRAMTLARLGDKEAAYITMRQIINQGHKTMYPGEILFMIEYICTELAEFADGDPLCIKNETIR